MGSRASFPAWLSRHVLLAEHATALNHRAQSILPDGPFAHGHNAQFARRANMPHAIALAASGKSRAPFHASRGLEEGRFAIVTNVGSGMRWTHIAERNDCADERRLCGRRSRVVLALQRRR